MERGLPWDVARWMSFFSVCCRNKPEVKWLQDCATLRCKQQRQPEARDLRCNFSMLGLWLCLALTSAFAQQSQPQLLTVD